MPIKKILQQFKKDTLSIQNTIDQLQVKPIKKLLWYLHCKIIERIEKKILIL